MNNLRILFYLFILFLAAACHPNKQYVKEIEVVYSMTEEHPDTAIYMLRKIHSTQDLSEKDYAIYQLLLTYHQARKSESQGDVSLSEGNYLKAIAEAEKAKDYKFTGLVYTRLSELYKRTGDYQRAFDAQQKAHVNYLLANNQENNSLWYWFAIPIILIILCLILAYRYQSRNKILQKQIEKQEKQLNATHKTISEQKLELVSLRKDMKVTREHIYNNSEMIRKVRAFNNLPTVSKEKPALSEQDWNNYLSLLEDNYGFVSSLRKTYPRLTDVDIRICALMKERVMAAHIGSVMNMVPDTLNKRIQRIKNEKMNLSGSSASLEVVLHGSEKRWRRLRELYIQPKSGVTLQSSRQTVCSLAYRYQQCIAFLIRVKCH